MVKSMLAWKVIHVDMNFSKKNIIIVSILISP